MNGRVRLNKVIELLEQGKTVFGTIVRNGNLDEIAETGDSDYDFCYIEMEHEGFSPFDLRNSVQHLINRKRVLEKGSLQPDVVPFVRIPSNTREGHQNQWVIKQSLDTGVFGLVLPHLSTADDARAAVVAARYPQMPGVSDFEPEGQRGWMTRLAARYWGLTPQEYYDVADPWPLDPDGELLLAGIVESAEGGEEPKGRTEGSQGHRNDLVGTRRPVRVPGQARESKRSRGSGSHVGRAGRL